MEHSDTFDKVAFNETIKLIDDEKNFVQDIETTAELNSIFLKNAVKIWKEYNVNPQVKW